MKIQIAETRGDMGRKAALDIAEAIRAHFLSEAGLRIIFAAAPSQRDMLAALIEEPGICCVPSATKSEAVRAMVEDPISGNCPATALRSHPRCTIYLDCDASAELNP